MNLAGAAIAVADFRSQFGSTARRLHLINEFDRELTHLCRQTIGLQIFAFGSFLSDKPEPGDLDLLVFGKPLLGIHVFLPYQQITAVADLHLKAWFSTSFTPRTCAQIVDTFNAYPANAANGISITENDLCEIIL